MYDALHELSGPYADEALQLIMLGTLLSQAEAQRISYLYETDTNPEYESYCDQVKAALEQTGRELPLGWFEGVFGTHGWVTDTKALHAIADLVMATLVRSDISLVAYNCLAGPFIMARLQSFINDQPILSPSMIRDSADADA